MKLKGINRFERYVDKVVMVVVALVALGVVAAQFFLQPNTITIGKSEVTLENAYKPVEDAANALKSKVNASTPDLPTPPKMDILQNFKTGLTGGVAPARE